MILAGLKLSNVLIGILLSSITIIILYILYKKLLAYLNKDAITKENYCVLYGLESQPSKGEIEFYFTNQKTKHVIFEILDASMSPILKLVENEYKPDGHIIRFDSTQLENGTYFYQLRTDNQKTMKRFEIKN